MSNETIEDYLEEVNALFDDGFAPERVGMVDAIKRAYMLGVQRQSSDLIRNSDPQSRGVYDPSENVCDVLATYYTDYLERIPEGSSGRYFDALSLAIDEQELGSSNIVSMISEMERRFRSGRYT